MAKNTVNVAKGVALALAAGAAVGYVSKKKKKKSPRTIRRKTNDAMNALGQIVNDISYILK